MLPETTDLLKQAKTLIENPEHWITQHWAMDLNDNPVMPHDPKAVSWCAIGAMKRSAADGFDNAQEVYEQAIKLLRNVAMDMTNYYYHQGTVIQKLNDYKGHDSVIEMFDRAIAIRETTDVPTH